MRFDTPMLLFQVLYGFCVASYVAFDGDVLGEFAVQFLALAEKQGATVPLMIGHRVMGAYLTGTGNLKQGQAHYDRAIALYEPSQHRPLATRFSADARVSVLSLRSWSLWCLGYPDAALADADRALGDAREIGQAATLMYALGIAAPPYLQCGNYAQASAMTDELVSLAEEKGALHWRALAIVNRGLLATLKGTASEAIQMLTSGIAARRSVGGTHWLPLYLSNLSAARAELGQFDDALRCIGEAMTAMETTKDRCCEAEVYRTAGKISLESPEPDAAKAQIYFERALAVARQQEAKSWELRAAMSMARLWRDQGKRTEARELLAPIYGWFTEGFDTLDLKEAKALLDELCVSR
jgi:predicted ATPase